MPKPFYAVYLTLCLFAATLLGVSVASAQNTTPGISAAAIATDETDAPAISTRLVSSHAEVTSGQTIQLAWEFKLEPHWHIYWRNAGDSGLAPQLKPAGNGKSEALALTFPTPKVISIPPLTNYGYENTVTFTTNFTVPEGLARGLNVFSFNAGFLYCKDVCMPGQAELRLPLVIAPRAKTNPEFKAATNLPQPLPQTSAIMAEATGRTIQLTIPLNLSGQSVRFLPFEDGVIDDSAPQNQTNNILSIQLDPQATSQPANLEGLLLVNGQGYTFSIPLHQTGSARTPQTEAAPQTTTPAESSASLSLLGALFFAVIAGLILNLMPCVLPVLSLKMLSLIKHHHGLNRTHHTLAYTAGVLASFWAFAILIAVLRQAGGQIGWGFHLQNPIMVAALVFLMLAVAFNFFGVFELGHGLTRLAAAPTGKGKSGANPRADLIESFATGVLAVVVATPCTVPFMGGAMAYALTQSLAEGLLIFTALGLGMALPFLISIPYPRLFHWLPKPGAWMNTFRHALGWPMLATALWLAYVFTSQTGQAGLFLLLSGVLVFAFTLWLFGVRPTRLTSLLPIAIAALTLFWVGSFANQPQSVMWQPWSAAAVEKALQDKTPVFVDFTADWCITCKVTEATVLNTDGVQKLFADSGTALFRGDWTNQNTEISAELARHNRRSVPLYLLYIPGKPVEVLPQLLTPGLLKEKLQGVSKQTSATTPTP